MKFKFFLIIILFCNISFSADNTSIRLLSTTSTRDSGLLEYLLPNFEKKYNIRIHVIALGTGHALEAAKNCDGDILLTHAPKLEKKFVKDGYGQSRYNLMYNDFVIIGPYNDPANIESYDKVIDVFQKFNNSNNLFISRGDSSGTDLSEKNIWKMINIEPKQYSGIWYLESGQGMGSTINIAIGKNAYTYTDRATWLKFKNKGNHKILFEGDPLMFNQYGLIRLNPRKCPNAKNVNIDNFYKWILSTEGQSLIGMYNYKGDRLFTPNYQTSYD
ncbi:MAG: Tungstate-binding protein TupA [Gammaproteobacteria bacterium]|nr:MAG: Tungstate-binding protein TupA [Gammaproteobacteria bacterium]